MSYIQTRGSFPKGMVPGLKSWIEKSFNDWTEEYSQIFDKVVSDREYEEYAGVIGYGLAQVKPEGQNIQYDAAKQGWVTRLYNVSYALGFMITYETMKDGKWLPKGMREGRALARSFRLTKETVAGLVLSRAFTSTYTGADGVELCSTAHVRKSDATTWSNELTTASDLSELSLEQLCIQIAQAQDERGNPIAIRPQKLIVHPNDMFNAERILNSLKQNDTANNAINAIKSMGAIPGGYVVNHYFDAGNGAWFLKTDAPDGLLYQEREAISFDSDNEFDSKNAKFAGFERYAVGWDSPYGIYGSAGAA